MAESSVEIPFWLFGQLKWVSGINKNTTCAEVVKALFKAADVTLDAAEFVIIEQWRKIERRLGTTRKILKVWEAWGEDKTEVRLVVKRQETTSLSSDDMRSKKKKHSQRLNQTRKLDTVHPRRLYNEKAVSKESIQQLMKIIIAQGTTIQSQLQGLRDREKAIENFEQKVHLLRMKESGKDYVLQTYLEQLPDGLTVSPRASRPKRQTVEDSRKKTTYASEDVPFDQLQSLTEYLERVVQLNQELERREEDIHKLTAKTRRHRERSTTQTSSSSSSVVPELEEILRLPLAALERELLLSRHEYQSLLHSIDSTIAESKRVQTDLAAIQERCHAGNIYIHNLETDLETAESEGEQLQKEFDWIRSLPPSAFATQEMLDWLRKDLHDFDSDSELGLEITSSQESSPNQSNILLPDQIHPTSRSADPSRSCSTGSTTSSGISSDIHSLVSPEPSILKSKSPIPPLPPKRALNSVVKTTSSSGVVGGGYKEEDDNSDTGLSSLNSSGEDQYSLDTLV